MRQALPTITLVTPSYNQGTFIGETLRSVIEQREDVREYFVLDGGSDDGSREIIERYAGRIDFWRSARDDGQGAAIVEGFRRATSDIIGWLNSDDVLIPGALRRVREAFARHPEWDVISGWDVLIDEASNILRVRRPGAQTPWAARWGVTHVSQPTCFFRRDFYVKVGGLNPDLGVVLDTELWLRMLRLGSGWGHIPGVLAAFRKHRQSKGARWLDKWASEQRILAAKYPEYCNRSLKHTVGVNIYRLKELVRGRYLADWLISRRLKGRRLSDVLSQGNLGG